MTDYPGLQVEKRGSTAVVTLSNPPANTWTRDSLDALVRLVDDLEADAGIRTLVLVGEGSSGQALVSKPILMTLVGNDQIGRAHV